MKDSQDDKITINNAQKSGSMFRILRRKEMKANYDNGSVGNLI